jgi:restriction system protein
MNIPKYDELLNPLFQAIRGLGGSASNEEMYAKVVASLGLSDEALSQLHDPGKGGSQTEVAYRLAWARTYLKKFGVLENSTHGVWSLTQKAQFVDVVDPIEVVKVVRAQSKKSVAGKKQPGDDVAQELVEDDDWKQSLSAILTELDPSAFERLMQRVLRESGFVQVEVTGKTGDGGIDGRGIARIHGFLSFHVLFQCKRYKGSVPPSDIRDFRGAMMGRADKGLFVTTGTFTPAAQKEAVRDGATPIDLIDGAELALKLKELSLGVKTELVERCTVIEAWFKGI